MRKEWCWDAFWVWFFTFQDSNINPIPLNYMCVAVFCRSPHWRVVLLSVVGKLVSWCKGLHQGWKQTSVYFQFIHSTSHYTPSLFFSNHNSHSIHNFETRTQKNNNAYFGACLYCTGTRHGNQHPAGWPTLFCGPTQEPVLATDNTGKTQKTLCGWML